MEMLQGDLVAIVYLGICAVIMILNPKVLRNNRHATEVIASLGLI
jgi:hypothetical protein